MLIGLVWFVFDDNKRAVCQKLQPVMDIRLYDHLGILCHDPGLRQGFKHRLLIPFAVRRVNIHDVELFLSKPQRMDSGDCIGRHHLCVVTEMRMIQVLLDDLHSFSIVLYENTSDASPAEGLDADPS